jgi:DNA (cytosine-5)-methyltransferase 1
LLASKPAQCGNVSASPKWWNIEPELGRVANGVPHWMDRVERLGNAQVPAVARLAFGILTARLTNDATDQQVGG